MRFFLAINLIMLATISNAQTRIECNKSGAVVTASNGTVYYLGKSCDAAQKGGDTGKWWYAASAFIVQIDGKKSVRFSDELNCDISYCRP